MCYMSRRLTVGVRELRQNLSVHLARVKRGVTLTVTEHGQVVALLRPAPPVGDAIERLIAEGRATPARRLLSELPKALTLRLKAPLSRVLDDPRDDSV